MSRHLLLISNSTNPGESYLGWPGEFIKDFLNKYKVKKVLFIPYAGVNISPESIEISYDTYEQRVSGVFSDLGFELQSVHKIEDVAGAVRSAQAIVVGGGNTFHLVKMMHETGIMDAIKEVVLQGVPFVGWSAGANVACPTMKTTNDMPIAEPPSFDCLNLIPFQINPHYLDVNPANHGGETREQRINEFLTVNRQMIVAGLRESCLFEVENNVIELKGKHPVRIFKFGKEPVEYDVQDDIGFLLK